MYMNFQKPFFLKHSTFNYLLYTDKRVAKYHLNKFLIDSQRRNILRDTNRGSYIATLYVCATEIRIPNVWETPRSRISLRNK